MEEGEDGRKWEDLQIDCLLNIFQRLGLEDLSVGVPFVCRSWYKASLSPILWQTLNFSEIDLRVPDSLFVERFMAQYHLEAFSFSGFLKFVVNRGRRSAWKVLFPSEGVSIEDWTCVAEQCPALSILALPDTMEKEVEKRIPDFICRWKELEWLCMQSIPVSFKEILSEINCHCHYFFGMVTRGWITADEVFSITKFLPKIKHLHLRGSFMTKGSLMLILEGCKELKVLDVRDCLGLLIDDEALKKASTIETFQYGGFLLEEEEEDTDEDKKHVLHVRMFLGDDDYSLGKQQSYVVG